MRRAIVCCLALAACGPRETARTVLSDTTGAPRVVAGSTAGAAALALWQLRPGVTLAEWKAGHADEEIHAADTTAVAQALGGWCAGAQRQDTIGARVVTRSAFFYPPAPTDLALPDSVPDLVARCELGLVWVRVDAPDTTAARLLADSLAEQLRAALGTPRNGPVHFFGAAFWKNTWRFRRGQVQAVSAWRPAPAGDTARSPSAFAFALLPVSQLSLDGAQPQAWSPPDTFPIDSAIRLAAVDTALGAPLLRLAAEGPGRGTKPPADLVRPIERWLAATAGLPAPRRAAALYVADRLLDQGACAHQLCEQRDAGAQAPLRALGATFTWGPLGGSWVYNRTWMNQARAIDRDSPLGQRILLAQLNAGFDFSGICGEGPDAFRRVIENGERYLERVPASPVAAEVHYLVAEAYRDIVALARGAAGDYADSSRYGGEAGAAATQALTHYRAAMRAGPQSEVAQAAWRRAWWLKAGLTPRDVRFYCIYD